MTLYRCISDPNCSQGVQLGLSCYYTTKSAVNYNDRAGACKKVGYSVWEADGGTETELVTVLLDEDVVWADEKEDEGRRTRARRQVEKPSSASGKLNIVNYL